MYCGVVVIENHTSTDATAGSEGSQSSQVSQDSQSSQGSEEMILTTKGDHNPIPDRYPVNADAYLGKMIGCVDYVGDLILFLYTHFDLITVLTVAMSLMSLATVLLRRSYLSAPPSTV